MKLSRLDLITIGGAALVPLLAYLLFFPGRLSHLKTHDANSAAAENLAASEREISREVIRTRHALTEAKKRVDEFMARMTTEDEAHRAVGAIVDEARKAGIDIELLKPGEPVEGKNLNHLALLLTASGQFPRLYDFLLRIQRSQNVMTIQELDVESKPNSDRCSIRIELRVYFVKPQTSADTGAAT